MVDEKNIYTHTHIKYVESERVVRLYEIMAVYIRAVIKLVL